MTRTQLEKLKKEAKAMRKTQGTPLHQALDLVAQRAGFHHWKHVSERAKELLTTIERTSPAGLRMEAAGMDTIAGDGSGVALPEVDPCQ